MSETATAEVSATQIAPGGFQYNVTLTDTGTTALGTFWFAWIPGQDYLNTSPTSVTFPTGWTDAITNEGPSDGFGIQWHVVSTSAGELTPGNSLSFSFTTADTPAEVFGSSSRFPSAPVLTAFVYSGEPLSDGGFELHPTVVTNVTSTITATTPGQVVSLTGGATELFVTVPDTVMQTGGTNTIISSAGSLTVNATGGSLTMYDSAGNDQVNDAPSTLFVGGVNGAASTLTGAAGGSDTIIPGSAAAYNGTQATSLLFVGGAGSSTVIGARNTVAFGGTGGSGYAEGSGSFNFVGAGASDTIVEGSGNAAGFIWGNSNENLTVLSVPGAASVHGASLVALGQADTINAQNGAGGNTFFIYNQIPPVAELTTFAGDTTLIGSNAGGDGFNVFIDSTDPAAHTITIENWQATDTAFLTDLSAAGGSVNAADTASIAAFEAPGGGQSLTLSDGTTIDFIGAKPITILHV